MMKKIYEQPTVKVVALQYQSNLLAYSLQSVKTSGLEDEEDLEYEGEGGNQGNAW